MRRSTYGPIVYRHSTNMSIACQPHSIDMSIECRSLVSIATRPRVPLIHVIQVILVFSGPIFWACDYRYIQFYDMHKLKKICPLKRRRKFWNRSAFLIFEHYPLSLGLHGVFSENLKNTSDYRHGLNRLGQKCFVGVEKLAILWRAQA